MATREISSQRQGTFLPFLEAVTLALCFPHWAPVATSNEIRQIRTRRLLAWLNNHGVAIGLLGDIAGEGGVAKPLDAQRMALLRQVFPELTGDPFWRIFQSLMLTSPEALLARDRLPMLAAQLRAVESFDAGHPRAARDLLDGRTLHDRFYLRDRAIKIALERSGGAYGQLHLDHRYASDARAKRAMLRAVVTASEIRAFWRESGITPDDVCALLSALPRDAGTRAAARAAEMLKRSKLRAIERQVALRFSGATWDELAAEDPMLAALEQQRSFGRETEDIEELGAYLANALTDRPADVLAWLERSFAQPDSFVSRVLQELRALVGSKQPIRQGDTSLEQLTYRLGLDSEGRLDFTAVHDVTSGRANSPTGQRG